MTELQERGEGPGGPEAQTSADYNAAMDKLRDEMAKSNDQAVGAIGEIMTALLQARPEWAGAILAKGKTLNGAYKAMENYARANRGGKVCVYVPPETAQDVICRYYGIKAEGTSLESEKTSSVPPSAGHLPQRGRLLENENAPEPDPFDLDALLGGI